MGASKVKALRQVLDAAVVSFQGDGRLLRRTIFIINAVLVAHQPLAVLVGIGASQVACPTLLVVEFEGTVQLQVVVRIAKAAVAIRVPEQTVVLVGQHERYADFGIILEQVLVLALHIKLLRLVLAEAIESLIVGRVELHLPRQAVLHSLRQLATTLDAILPFRNGEVPETLALLTFLQQHSLVLIEEGDLSVVDIDLSHDLGCLDADTFAVQRVSRKLGLGCLGHNDKTLLLRQLCLAGCLHPDDVVVDHLQAHHLSAACRCLLHRDGHILTADGIVVGHQHHSCQRQHSRTQGS